jgi:hypothetical protein
VLFLIRVDATVRCGSAGCRALLCDVFGSSSLLGVWSVLLLILGFPVGRSLLVAVGVGVRVV